LKFFTTASKAQLAAEGKRGPLAGFVDKGAAQRQQQATDLRNQVRDQERALRDAFRGKPPVPPIGAALAGEAGKGKDAINELGVSWKGLLRIFATQFAFQALGNFIGAVKDATSAAIDFELQLARIGTISQEFSARGLDATADTIEELSSRFGTPIEEAAAGLYNILSDQIESASEALEVFAVANELAAATGADASDTAALLTGVINAYGLSAGNAREISDQFFVTIDKGRVSAQGLANTFDRIAPLAAQLGIDLTEVNASLAELTIQGVKEDDAMTQLTNVMLKLIKPTEALQAEFARLGISSAEAGITIFGFEGLLRKLTENTGESATEIGKLFNQIRGTRGVVGIISRDAADFQETLKAIQEASKGVGATAEASAKVLGTPAATVKKELTELRNFLVDDIGRGILSFAALTSSH
jgi:TP901 family phage tail tape measure protein